MGHFWQDFPAFSQFGHFLQYFPAFFPICRGPLALDSFEPCRPKQVWQQDAAMHHLLQPNSATEQP
eukprot:4668441-Amphidinium_carterae.1